MVHLKVVEFTGFHHAGVYDSGKCCRRTKIMPTLNLFTNVPVDSAIASDILREATKAIARIIGKPKS
ncbi:unnamed protein product [Lupinus luteus]|uniref:Uncharacterized protein n=1 Tax=Lupinus luteus TaxID=3873 RepID=A0AAV1VRC7_LUPLU